MYSGAPLPIANERDLGRKRRRISWWLMFREVDITDYGDRRLMRRAVMTDGKPRLESSEGCLWKASMPVVSLLLVISMGGFIYNAPGVGVIAAIPFGLWVLWWMSMLSQARSAKRPEFERRVEQIRERHAMASEDTGGSGSANAGSTAMQNVSQARTGPSADVSALVDRPPRVLGECPRCGSEYMSGDNWCECGALLPLWDCAVCHTINQRVELNAHCSTCFADTYLGNGPWRMVRAIKNGEAERAPILRDGF